MSDETKSSYSIGFEAGYRLGHHDGFEGARTMASGLVNRLADAAEKEIEWKQHFGKMRLDWLLAKMGEEAARSDANFAGEHLGALKEALEQLRKSEANFRAA